MSYSVITFDRITDPEDRKNIEFLRSVAEKCRKLLVSSGATRFTCTIERTVGNEFNVDGGKFSLFRTQYSDGLSLTCYVGDKKGTANVSSSLAEDKNIISAVKDAVASANAATPDPAWIVAPKAESKIFLKGAPVFDKETFFSRFAGSMEDIGRNYPLILVEQAIASHNKCCSLYFNSSGTEFITVSGFYTVDFLYSGHDGDNASSFFGTEFVLTDPDISFTDKAFFKKSLENTQKQIYTKPFKGKKTGRLITTPSLTEELISAAFYNFAEDYCVLNGTSLWLDKLGKKVADDRLTVRYTTTDGRVAGGQTYTEEGYLAEDYNVIENGVLKNFDISAYVANKTGNRRAPNSGDNMIIKNGTRSIEDMIKETEFGIYAARFSGGEPSVNGDFSGVAKNSFLIENGKLTKALSETMISGNLADMLNNIVDISLEQDEDGVNVIPYISFDGITISGE